MKLVRIEVLPARDKDVVRAIIIAQRNSGGVWTEFERHHVRSDTPGQSRTVLLEDNERIVVDGWAEVELVVDKEQNAVVERHRPAAGVGLDTTPSRTPYVQDALTEGPQPGPLPPGTESQVGVWREADGQEWSRTGSRYRIY